MRTVTVSLNRLKTLPAGAVVIDARGTRWTRLAPDERGRPGWWSNGHHRAPTAYLHSAFRPLREDHS